MRLKLLLAATLMLASQVGHAQTAPADKYIWLEDVSSPKAMEWVNSHSAASVARLEPDPHYKNTEGRHGSGADLKQSARTTALTMTYLQKKLMD